MMPPSTEHFAVLLTRTTAAGPWKATIVVAADDAPIEVHGPSSSFGLTPACALDQLMTRRLGCLTDSQMPATLVGVEQLELPS